MRIPRPDVDADRPRDDRPEPPQRPTYPADPEDGHPLSVDPTAAHDHAGRPTAHRGHGGHGGHGLVMMLMCVPMLLIAGLLVATGVGGAGVLVFAVLCMAMMFMMPGGRTNR